MATIDTSKIEGFETMTAEQKLDAVLKHDIPEPDMSGFVPKAIADRYASEAAEYKKQLNAKLTDDEKAKAEADKAQKELQEKYEALLKTSTIADHTAKFLALGYSADLAKSTAEALYSGDKEKVFANQQTFNAEKEKAIRAELVKKDPKPGGAGGDDNEKTAGEKLAESIGKSNAAASKAANDVISQYVGGNK